MAVINDGSTRRGMELGTVQIINFYFNVKLKFQMGFSYLDKKGYKIDPGIQRYRDTRIQGYSMHND